MEPDAPNQPLWPDASRLRPHAGLEPLWREARVAQDRHSPVGPVFEAFRLAGDQLTIALTSIERVLGEVNPSSGRRDWASRSPLDSYPPSPTDGPPAFPG